MEYAKILVLRCPITHQILRPQFTGDRLEPEKKEEPIPEVKPAPPVVADLSATE